VKLPELRAALELLMPPHPRDGKRKRERLAGKRARALCRRWLSSPDIIGIGVGPRQTEGKLTHELALRVHVKKKLPRAELGKNRIPPVIRLPTLARPILIDVVESDIPSTQRASVGDGILLDGVDRFGTIGCVTRRKGTADLFAVTCCHVLEGAVNALVVGAGFPPHADPPHPTLGRLAAKSRFSTAGNFPNFTDIALVRMEPGAVDPVVRGLGTITGIRTTPLQPLERVRLCGLGTSLTNPQFNGVCEGRVMESHAMRWINNEDFGLLGFRDVVVCTRFTEARDSGAGVLDANNRLVGIHFAGTAATAKNPLSLFQPIQTVFAAFGLSLVSGEAIPAALPLAVPDAPVPATPLARAPPPVGTRSEALDTLARTIWGEARNEPEAGMRAVANVVLNRIARVNPKRFGGTVEQVCRKKLQFSCWNPGDPNLPKLTAVTDSNAAFRACLEIARAAVDGELADNTIHSDHYHTKSVLPKWAVGRTPAITIGHHLFYNDIP
jgi:hypothetical protein